MRGTVGREEGRNEGRKGGRKGGRGGRGGKVQVTMIISLFNKVNYASF